MKTALPLADRAAFPAEGFVEGLWQQDVAEFFVADRRTGHYQEFNLGPGGAWWSATFCAPRLRVVPQPEWQSFGVLAKVLWTNREWIGQLSVPLPAGIPFLSPPSHRSGAERLMQELESGQLAVNFTAITAGRAGPRFYSLAHLRTATPDFHRPADWIAM